MQNLKMLALLMGACMLILAGCTDAPTDNDTNGDVDRTEPSLTVSSYNDTVTIDEVSLNGSVDDESGIDHVAATPSGGTKEYATVSSGQWNITLSLKPGLNNILLVAEDNAGNTRNKTVLVYYKANYLPISANSSWIFETSIDIPSITVVDTGLVGSVPFYTLTVANPFQNSCETTFVVVHINGVFKMGEDEAFALSNSDTLFLEEYTNLPRVYAGLTAVYVGDVEDQVRSITYKNCVKVMFGTQDQLCKIEEIVLSPDHGPVQIKANTKEYMVTGP